MAATVYERDNCRGTASLRYRNRTDEPFSCVNRKPYIQYGFCACALTVLALNFELKEKRNKCMLQ